jgi:hypothetical protein
MKSAWEKYLESVGVNGLFLDRAKYVVNFYDELYPNAVDDVFVSEYVDKDGQREFESLWIVSDNFICEAKAFLTQDDFDSTPLPGNIVYWTIKKEEFDFKVPTAKSRMILSFRVNGELTCTMKASGENCSNLRNLFLKIVLPRSKKAGTH